MKKTVKDYLHFDTPTSDQVKVLNAMHTFVQAENRDHFMIINGAAGTGKTSIISALVQYLDHSHNGYQIAAPTGRAARIIGNKVGGVASTIHSLIFTPKTNTKTGNVSFNLKDRKDEVPVVYIIDESSMIPSKGSDFESNFGTKKDILSSIIEFVYTANISNKIIFIGDSYQLPPYGEDLSAALDEKYLSKKYKLKGSKFVLSEVKRQESGSYILENATSIRNAIEEGKSYHKIDGSKLNSIYQAAYDYSNSYKANGAENNVVIGVSHKANRFFNDLVRSTIYGNVKQILEPGDLMMVTRNWSRKSHLLCNGDQVEILEVDWDGIETVCDLNFVPVKFRPISSDEEISDYLLIETITNLGGYIDQKKEVDLLMVRYAKNRALRETKNNENDRYLGAIRLIYGHAITCQKAQGGEWNKVYLNSYYIPSLRWQYTAVTRGVENILTF